MYAIIAQILSVFIMFENLQSRVRLKDFEIKAIQKLFAKYFLISDHIWLFGSRANLTKHGGDIDLYIETTLPSLQAFDKKLKLYGDLCDRIGEQKIDIVINTINQPDNLVIYQVARNEGVQLG